MGQLRLLSVPIGNLEDITLRVLNILKKDYYFFVEDSRSFFKLLSLLNISRENICVDTFHDQSVNKLDKIIKLLKAGQTVNLLSEAGSPVISDPAFPAIKEVLQRGFKLETFPGVSSVITALELSGLPPKPFCFSGFLPRKENEIIKAFQQSKEMTTVFFESPKRIIKTLNILNENFDKETSVVVARELTKKFESIYRFKLSQIDEIKKNIILKGEMVVIVNAVGISKKTNINSQELQDEANKYLNKPSKKQLCKILSKILNTPTKEIYSQLL